MFLTEEVDPRLKSGEVVSAPQPIGDNVGTPSSVVSLAKRWRCCCPKPEAFRQLAELPQTPAMVNHLAALYQAQKEYESAEQLDRRALRIAERTQRVPGEVATLLNHLSSLFPEQRKHAEAESLYRKSLERAEKTFGPKHQKAARTCAASPTSTRPWARKKWPPPLLARLKGMR